MKNIKLILLSLLFLSGSTAQAGRPLDNPGLLEKGLEWFEQSTPVCWYNDWLAKHNKPNTQGEPIPAQLLERIKNAQTAAGIPPHRHVAVDRLQDHTHCSSDTMEDKNTKDQKNKWITTEADIMAWAWQLDQPTKAEKLAQQDPCDQKSNSQPIEPTAGGHADPGLISLHPNVEQLPEHLQNHIVCHEIDHIARNARAMLNIIGTVPLLRLFLIPKYHHFCEQRADIKGAYATQCWCCVSLNAQQSASKEARTTYFTKISQIKNKLHELSDQEKVDAYLEYARQHWPQHMETINALSEKDKKRWAQDFFTNQALPRIDRSTQKIKWIWDTYVQTEGFNIIAGQLLHESEQNICEYHADQIKQDPEFRQEMLAAKPVITAALEEYLKQQERTLYNRGKKLARKSSLLAHTGARMLVQVSRNAMKQAAQPRAALPATLLKINNPLI